MTIERLIAKEGLEPFSVDDVRRFLKSEITWAEMAGMTREQAYAIAELGFNLFTQGKLTEAKKLFEGLITLNPKDSYFHSMLGSINARKKNWDEALRSFDLAIENGTLDPQVFVNRAEIYLLMGQFEEALRDLDKAISYDPKGENPASVRARTMAKNTVQSIDSVLRKTLQTPI